ARVLLALPWPVLQDAEKTKYVLFDSAQRSRKSSGGYRSRFCDNTTTLREEFPLQLVRCLEKDKRKLRPFSDGVKKRRLVFCGIHRDRYIVSRRELSVAGDRPKHICTRRA